MKRGLKEIDCAIDIAIRSIPFSSSECRDEKRTFAERAETCLKARHYTPQCQFSPLQENSAPLIGRDLFFLKTRFLPIDLHKTFFTVNILFTLGGTKTRVSKGKPHFKTCEHPLEISAPFTFLFLFSAGIFTRKLGTKAVQTGLKDA